MRPARATPRLQYGTPAPAAPPDPAGRHIRLAQYVSVHGRISKGEQTCASLIAMPCAASVRAHRRRTTRLGARAQPAQHCVLMHPEIYTHMFSVSPSTHVGEEAGGKQDIGMRHIPLTPGKTLHLRSERMRDHVCLSMRNPGSANDASVRRMQDRRRQVAPCPALNPLPGSLRRDRVPDHARFSAGSALPQHHSGCGRERGTSGDRQDCACLILPAPLYTHRRS